MKITHINPKTLHHHPAFSQVVTVEGSGKTVYVGGQNGVDRFGNIVSDDLGPQTEQAMRNVTEALASVDASPKDVVKLNIYIVQGESVQEAFMAAQNVQGWDATAITVLLVAGLAHPKYRIEIEAIAAIG